MTSNTIFKKIPSIYKITEKNFTSSLKQKLILQIAINI